MGEYQVQKSRSQLSFDFDHAWFLWIKINTVRKLPYCNVRTILWNRSKLNKEDKIAGDNDGKDFAYIIINTILN